MPVYRTNELTFDVPPQLKDKSLHIFTASDDAPNPFSLVISRSPVAAGTSLAAFGRTLSSELSRTLPEFQLLRSELTTLDGEPAILLDYSWSNQGASMHQRQVSLLHSPSPGALQAVQLTATLSSGPENWMELFDRMLATVRLERPASPDRAPPAIPPVRPRR